MRKLLTDMQAKHKAELATFGDASGESDIAMELGQLDNVSEDEDQPM